MIRYANPMVKQSNDGRIVPLEWGHGYQAPTSEERLEIVENLAKSRDFFFTGPYRLEVVVPHPAHRFVTVRFDRV